MKAISAFLIVALASSACVCSRGKDEQKSPSAHAAKTATDTATTPVVADNILKYSLSYRLDQTQAATDIAEFTRSPHPFGSPRQSEIITWLESRLQKHGIKVVRDPFTAMIPNPAALNAASGPVADTLELAGANVVALEALKSDTPCVVALGTHFDTKIVSGTEYVGANDGGSSTIALLQQLHHLKSNRPAFDLTCDIVGFFFDGEEALLANWTDGQTIHPAKIQDNTYGSRSLAARLTSCTFEDKPARCLPSLLGGKPLIALVLMDMIGSPTLQISRDGNSTKILRDLAEAGAKTLGIGERYDRYTRDIEDDHIHSLLRRFPR